MRLEMKLLTALMALVMAAPMAAEEQKCDSDAIACLKYMVDNLEGKGWLGVELSGDESLEVLNVVENSPAETAGIRVGDLFVALNSVRYASATDDARAEAKRALVPGNRVTVTLSRDGGEIDVEVVAGKVPDSVLAQWIGNHMLHQHRHQIADVDPD